MASGVVVADCVVEMFNKMKVRKSCTPEEAKRRLKAVIFCLSDDKKTIIPEEGKQILVGDCDDIEDPYMTFVEMLPRDDCRYALYDCYYSTKETRKEDLVFFFWAPESATLKSKMIYASSKDAIKKKFAGCKHEMQVNSRADLKDRCTLAEKLGGSCVTSLEGKPLTH